MTLSVKNTNESIRIIVQLRSCCGCGVVSLVAMWKWSTSQLKNDDNYVLITMIK